MKDQIEVQAILWTGHLLRGMPLSDPTTALLQAINKHRLTRNGLESNSKTSLVSTVCEINRWCPGRPIPNGRKDMASTSTPNENPIGKGGLVEMSNQLWFTTNIQRVDVHWSDHVLYHQTNCKHSQRSFLPEL
jgi:hypothetical protein